eukprot:GILK01004703.1.p1 GENE.GILK01004703.1~~GILK01004703.1.p1  ORF type:complete len:153 (-),score=29.79 GILK01004703.1:152-610(-)
MRLPKVVRKNKWFWMAVSVFSVGSALYLYWRNNHMKVADDELKQRKKSRYQFWLQNPDRDLSKEELIDILHEMGERLAVDLETLYKEKAALGVEVDLEDIIKANRIVAEKVEHHFGVSGLSIRNSCEKYKKDPQVDEAMQDMVRVQKERFLH